jgi:hypothetical protein
MKKEITQEEIFKEAKKFSKKIFKYSKESDKVIIITTFNDSNCIGGMTFNREDLENGRKL